MFINGNFLIFLDHIVCASEYNQDSVNAIVFLVGHFGFQVPNSDVDCLQIQYWQSWYLQKVWKKALVIWQCLVFWVLEHA